MKRETIVEEPEDDSDYNDCDNSSSPAIISVWKKYVSKMRVLNTNYWKIF